MFSYMTAVNWQLVCRLSTTSFTTIAFSLRSSSCTFIVSIGAIKKLYLIRSSGSAVTSSRYCGNVSDLFAVNFLPSMPVKRN